MPGSHEKVVVVTGAAGGIGSATTDLLAEEGWKVVGVDIQGPRNPNLSDAVEGDSSAESVVTRSIELVESKYGRLDGVVVNAAIQLNKTILETSFSEWNEIIRVNLSAAFLWLKYGFDLLRTSKGAVVNISSVHAIATTGRISAYAATKGGLMAFTRAAALELAEHGVRVNAVLPGATDTKMLRHGFGRGHLNGVGADVDAQMALLANRHPLGRIASPEEIAKAVAFLLDAEAAGFITGQGLTIDGGATIKLSTE